MRAHIWLLFGLLSFLSVSAHAELSPALNRFQMAIGGYAGKTDTTFRAILRTPNGRIEREANLENNGHIHAHQNVVRYQMAGVVGDHQGWALDYYSLLQNREGAGPTFFLPIKGRNVEVAPASHLRLQIDLGTATYLYWMGNGRNVFGVGGGAAYYHINLKIQGIQSVTYAKAKFAPSISVAYIHAFDDGWKFYVHAQGIAKNTGESQGHIYHGVIGISRSLGRHWTAGLEYGVAHLNIQQTLGPYTGAIDLNVHGPGIYMGMRW